jgi:hypothetical protein
MCLQIAASSTKLLMSHLQQLTILDLLDHNKRKRLLNELALFFSVLKSSSKVISNTKLDLNFVTVQKHLLIR